MGKQRYFWSVQNGNLALMLLVTPDEYASLREWFFSSSGLAIFRDHFRVNEEKADYLELVSQKKLIESEVVAIQSFLEEHHFIDAASNDDLDRFYATEAGRKILDSSCYPETINEFLGNEKRQLEALLTAARAEGFERVIEAGCGATMPLRDLVIQAGFKKYVGVDLNRPAVDSAKLKLASEAEGAFLSEIHCASILHLPWLNRTFSSSERGKTLVVLPFNLIGNLGGVVNTFRILSYAGFARVYVSCYALSEGLREARRRYYQGCGCQDLRDEAFEGVGEVFTSREGLKTFAYAPEILTEIARVFGFDVQMGQVGDSLMFNCRLLGGKENRHSARGSIDERNISEPSFSFSPHGFWCRVESRLSLPLVPPVHYPFATGDSPRSSYSPGRRSARDLDASVVESSPRRFHQPDCAPRCRSSGN